MKFYCFLNWLKYFFIDFIEIIELIKICWIWLKYYEKKYKIISKI